MNPALNPQQFQTQLGQYVAVFTPDYWPIWLTLAGLAFIGMLAILALHALLRYKFAVPDEQHPHQRLYLYNKAVRCWHWANATLFILLLASGLINHFALVAPEASAGLVTLHKACGILLLICWLAFILINLLTGNGRHYIIQPKGFIQRALLQARYYLYGIIKGENHPIAATEKSKFNPLQQVAYIGVVYALIPLLILSGLIALNPQWLVGSLAFIKPWILTIHFTLAIIGLFFVAGHLYLCTTGKTPTETFKAMVDGYHR